jgi:hypothetical protein
MRWPGDNVLMKKPKRRAAGPTEIARLAGVSKQLASRKLRQGKTPAQIIAEAEAARTARKANGHAASIPSAPTFAAAQCRKENALAVLRELEVATRMGELIPRYQVTGFLSRGLVAFRDALLRLPGELSDRLAAETSPAVVHDILDGRLRDALQGFARLKEEWANRPFSRDETV